MRRWSDLPACTLRAMVAERDTILSWLRYDLEMAGSVAERARIVALVAANEAERAELVEWLGLAERAERVAS